MNRYLDIHSYLHRVGFAFRALQSKNFRMFFFSGMLSLMGTWIQNLALGWLVYRLTDSAFYLGLVGFAGQIPALFFAPLAGVYADRMNRRQILILTQIVPMVLAFVLSYLVCFDKIQISLVLIIVVINGFALAFDTPFRHAFLLEMIGDRKLLINAVALNSTLVNTARFIGPTIGGILIALYGEAFCFFVNGFSFLGMIIALMSMKIPRFIKKTGNKSVFSDLKEGFLYTFDFKPARYMILLVIMTSIFGLPFQAFLPVFARDILSGNSQLLGFLTGAVGAGALTGAFFLASRDSIKSIPNIIRFSAFLFAFGLVSFSLSQTIWLSMVILFFSGFGMIVQFAATNTLLQTVVDEDKRGRVLSFYSMSFLGFTPIGSLMLGTIAKYIGVPYTFTLAGIALLLAAGMYNTKLSAIKRILS
ncbi:MAG: MFS transporter [Bacteroidetes bacterium HGW-Bacteroidetes-1]|jgi:MFS family permease|nr:MAG: MFS transporter [Bacteroidetes bacterium HGW-Bacteroidetes-1]